MPTRLKETCERGDIDRRTMIVRRGNDSSTWNVTAGAWNKARESWIALIHSPGMEDSLDRMCPGKVLRLMAADVAGWHRRAGGGLDPDTRVWNDLPPPWEGPFDMRDRRHISLRKARRIAIGGLVALVVGGCGCRIALVIESARAWHREVAPFEALGARVVATGGGDMGRWAGREGVSRIYFQDNVGDSEIAGLAGRMERFPHLETLALEGPKVTDACIAHLKRLKHLRTLLLYGTRVTERGKSDLQRALPDLSGL